MDLGLGLDHRAGGQPRAISGGGEVSAPSLARIGSLLEQEGCKAFPWAHNGEQDDHYALMYGVAYSHASAGGKKDIAEKNTLSPPALDGDACHDRGDGKPGPCPLGKTVDERSWKDGPGTRRTRSSPGALFTAGGGRDEAPCATP